MDEHESTTKTVLHWCVSWVMYEDLYQQIVAGMDYTTRNQEIMSRLEPVWRECVQARRMTVIAVHNLIRELEGK